MQRGGAPSVEDRTFATQMGILSVELINNNISNVALGISNNRVFAVDIEKAVNAKRDFNLEMYNDLRKLYRLKAIK